MPLSQVEYVEQHVQRGIQADIQRRHNCRLIPTGSHQTLVFPHVGDDINYVANRLQYVGYRATVDNANRHNSAISRPEIESMWTHLVRIKMGWYTKIATDYPDPDIALQVALADPKNVLPFDQENLMDFYLRQMLGEVGSGFLHCSMDDYWYSRANQVVFHGCLFDTTSPYKTDTLECMYQAWLANQKEEKAAAEANRSIEMAAGETKAGAVDSPGDMDMEMVDDRVGKMTDSAAALSLGAEIGEETRNTKRRRLE